MAITEDLLAEIAKSMPRISSKAAQRTAPQTRMRKRHWFLSSAIILGCSWITHTTTATISFSEKQSLPAFYKPALTNLSLANSAKSQQTPEQHTPPLANTAPASTPKILAMASAATGKTSESAPKLRGLRQPSAQTSPAATLESRPHKIGRGESLGTIFKKSGLDLAIPHHISKHAVAKQLTSIRAGKVIDFRFDNDTLKEIHYPVNALKELVVSIDGVNVEKAAILDVAYETKQKTVSTEINSSLYLAAQNAGLSNNLTMEMVRIFGWDIDFVQDIRVGDQFHVVFDEYFKNGEKLADGNILAAEFTTQGQTYRAIRFEDKDGVASYFNAEGESMLGTFLRSPVEFSRISSRFGKRKHPISKKWKAHKGVDYAAARGTPIRATADGKVTLAGRKGGYGKTVVLRHAGRFTTLYAHMNGYAKGIKSGARVKQGQVIGYVGSTGMSTGPHLHYEFRVNGVHRNSLTYKTPKASSVSKESLPSFNLLAKNLGSKLDSIRQDYELAKSQQTVKSKKT